MMMASTSRFIGRDPVLESGSVLLGPGDILFSITIDDLSFEIGFTHDPFEEQVKAEPTSRRSMRVILNTYQTTAPTFKGKVGTLHGNDLYLSLHLTPLENFHLLTYTFSRKGGR
jgi:hypothetical protein